MGKEKTFVNSMQGHSDKANTQQNDIIDKMILARLKLIFHAMSYIIVSNNMEIPYADYQGKKAMPKEAARNMLKEQGRFFDEVICSIRLELINTTLHVVVLENQVKKDIMALLTATENVKWVRKENKILFHYPNAVDRAKRLLRNFLEENRDKLLSLLIDNPPQGDEHNKIADLLRSDGFLSEFWPKTNMTSGIIGKSLGAEFSRDSERKKILESRRSELSKLLSSGDLATYPDIDLKKDWPIHPLMVHIRRQIIPVVDEIVRSTDLLFDPQDLEHQILFRLTTFAPSELFKKGALLEEYLEQTGVYQDWRKIPKLDPNIVSEFSLNKHIVQQVVEEQLLITQDRMNKSKLPLAIVFKGIRGNDRVFTRNEDERYRLQWYKIEGEKHLAAVKVTKQGNIIDSINVKFRRMNKNELAIKYTRDLYYLHTDRAQGDAFGFYLEGSDFPFAIETVESTINSLSFRHDALLMRGFDADHGIELTRLYTWPGSPRNIIGLADRLVIKYYKSTSNIEVVITTVTPSYAKTRSTTIAGGIEHVLYVRPLSHKFIRREISGTVVWQYITIRNLNGLDFHDTDIIETNTRFPLYPSVGAYKQIGRRSFSELPEIQGKIPGFNFLGNSRART